MDSKMNIWDKQQQNWIKEILSKSGTELKEISDKNGKLSTRNKNQNYQNPIETSDLILYRLIYCEVFLKKYFLNF